MPKKEIIASPIKELIAEARESGRKIKDIADQFHVSEPSVSRTYSRWKRERFVGRRPKSGRPRKTTEKEERRLVRDAKADPTRTSTDIIKKASEEMNKELSKSAAQRILRRSNLFGRRPAKKPLLSKKNRRARLAYAKKYKNQDPDIWNYVIWSDWTKVNLVGSDGVKYVRRPPGLRFNNRYLVKTVKHGGGSLMMWGKSLIMWVLVILICFRLLLC